MQSKGRNNKYLIKQYVQQDYPHGGIGYVDAERIIISQGFEPIEFPEHEGFSFRAKLTRFFFLLRLLVSIKRSDTVLFLFPVYARMNKLLLRLLQRKKVSLICFIADINGIKDADEKELVEEIAFLQQFKKFIVHNEGMKKWLKEKIAVDQVETIGFFDFLAIPVSINPSYSPGIVFAGNLEKSPFLEKLYLLEEGSPTLHFHVYGPGQTTALLSQKNVSWHGWEKPHELPAKLQGSFGLVWDDACIDRPCGGYGDYMPYISHHKLSLYILSRLPILVPGIAGSAPLVEKYGIGVSINSLYEIEEKIRTISPEHYLQMQENMKQLAERISRGECLAEAVRKFSHEE
jgi:hypothetical protein